MESWTHSALPPSSVWHLICCHSERDSRCGLHGSQLLAALDVALTQQSEDAALLECSHLNGHRYAAVCIAVDWSQRETQWYGCIRPEDAERLVRMHAAAGGGQGAHSSDEEQQQWMARHKR